MAFEHREWDLSGLTAGEFIEPEAGERYLEITDASYDDANMTYSVSFRDLHNEAEFSLRYWPYSIDARGRKEPNKRDIGTLGTLGSALAGENIGIPHPADIVGGVVMGEVVLKEVPSKTDPTKMRKFARIYKFGPVPYDFAMIATIDQYWIGQENEPAEGSE